MKTNSDELIQQQVATERELIEEAQAQRQQQPQKSDELERQILEVLRDRLARR
jgi:uncharacterized protein (DUF2267 family)